MSKPTTSDMTVAEILEAVRIGGWYDANPDSREADYMDVDVALAAIEAHYAAKERADMEYVIGGKFIIDDITLNSQKTSAEAKEVFKAIAEQSAEQIQEAQRQRMAERLNNTEEGDAHIS